MENTLRSPSIDTADRAARDPLCLAPVAAMSMMLKADLCLVRMRHIGLYFLRSWSEPDPALQVAASVVTWLLERGYIARVEHPDEPSLDFYLLTAAGRRRASGR